MVANPGLQDPTLPNPRFQEWLSNPRFQDPTLPNPTFQEPIPQSQISGSQSPIPDFRATLLCSELSPLCLPGRSAAPFPRWIFPWIFPGSLEC